MTLNKIIKEVMKLGYQGENYIYADIKKYKGEDFQSIVSAIQLLQRVW